MSINFNSNFFYNLFAFHGSKTFGFNLWITNWNRQKSNAKKTKTKN